MKKVIVAVFALGVSAAAFAIPACSDDTTSTGDVDAGFDAGPPDTGPPDTGPVTPPIPTLGAQIDRFGRPAVNTALIHSFDGNAATAGAAKDAYNALSDTTQWVPNNRAEIAKNLAILDALDTGLGADFGGCGNQPLASTDVTPNRYNALASLLADDRMWINTAATTCTQYLALELNETMILENTDCGGRTLKYDVIDTTYSITSGTGLTGLTDNVAAVPAKTSGTTFPYLANPL